MNAPDVFASVEVIVLFNPPRTVTGLFWMIQAPDVHDVPPGHALTEKHEALLFGPPTHTPGQSGFATLHDPFWFVPDVHEFAPNARKPLAIEQPQQKL